MKQLQVVEQNLTNLIKQKQAALPENFNQTRFIQNSIAALENIKDIEKIEPLSIARTLLKGAFLGLDFFNKECYAIPYNRNVSPKGEKPKYVKELQFQTDYKGERKLALKYALNPIKDIFCMMIHMKDADPEITVIDGQQVTTFTRNPLLFGTKPDDYKGVFGCIVYEDGTQHYEIMSIEEVEHIRKSYSKVANSPAWIKSYSEMAKKTLMRRMLKGVNLDFRYSEQDAAFSEASDTEFTDFQEVTEPVKMPEPKKKPRKPAKKTAPVETPSNKFITGGELMEIAKLLKDQGVNPKDYGKYLNDNFDVPSFSTDSITPEKFKEIKKAIVHQAKDNAPAPKEETDPVDTEKEHNQRADYLLYVAQQMEMKPADLLDNETLTTRESLLALPPDELKKLYEKIYNQVNGK